MPLAAFAQAFMVQVKPASAWHVDEQPSPSRKLPSSHCSLSTMPSPQFEAQPVVPGHTGSSWQLAEQPSYGSLLPSSQLSAPSFTLSPQTVATQALGEPAHLKPTSI